MYKLMTTNEEVEKWYANSQSEYKDELKNDILTLNKFSINEGIVRVPLPCGIAFYLEPETNKVESRTFHLKRVDIQEPQKFELEKEEGSVLAYYASEINGETFFRIGHIPLYLDLTKL